MTNPAIPIGLFRYVLQIRVKLRRLRALAIAFGLVGGAEGAGTSSVATCLPTGSGGGRMLTPP